MRNRSVYGRLFIIPGIVSLLVFIYWLVTLIAMLEGMKQIGAEPSVPLTEIMLWSWRATPTIAIWWGYGYYLASLPMAWLCRYWWTDQGDDEWRTRAIVGSISWPLFVIFAIGTGLKNLIEIIVSEVSGWWELAWGSLALLVMHFFGRPLRAAGRFLSWVGQRLQFIPTIPDRIVFRLTQKKLGEDEYGELWTAKVPNAQQTYLEVRVKDTTGNYRFRVPPETRTPLEGVAWSYNVTMPDIKRSVRF